MDEAVLGVIDSCSQCSQPEAAGSAEQFAESEDSTLRVGDGAFVRDRGCGDSLLGGGECCVKRKLLLPRLAIRVFRLSSRVECSLPVN